MTNIEEIWKDVVGYEGLYQVSNLGNVKSIDRQVNSAIQKIVIRLGKNLKPTVSRWGYAMVGLSRNNIAKNVVIHRLVAKAFILNPENKPQVNHKDGNKLNNNVLNLEWCTPSYNSKHAYDTGLNAISTGQYHGSAKLTDQDIEDLKYLMDSGMVNYKEMPGLFGISRSYAFKIQHRKVRLSSIKREKRIAL